MRYTRIAIQDIARFQVESSRSDRRSARERFFVPALKAIDPRWTYYETPGGYSSVTSVSLNHSLPHFLIILRSIRIRWAHTSQGFLLYPQSLPRFSTHLNPKRPPSLLSHSHRLRTTSCESMENYSYSSYPDSVNSSPRSREIDCENQAWEEPPNYRVKFMCSYGGKIHPRPHDNQLAYVGGDTKILAIDRNIKFSGMLSKLSSLWDTEVCFKYQLPGEDLDALISVTNDEDLEHMMLEYDRLHRTAAKPARLRLFLFPLNTNPSGNSGIPPVESKPDQQWFVDALNSAPVQPLPNLQENSQGNPDFLFGFDKGTKVPESVPELPVSEASPASSPSVVENRDGFPAGSEVLKEEQQIGEQGIQGMVPPEIQRQIQEFQRMQIAATNQEQQAAFYQRRPEETLPRTFPDMPKIPAGAVSVAGSIAGDYYLPKAQEQNRFDQVPPAAATAVPAPSPMAPPATAAYWPERQVPGTDQQVYYIQAGSGVYPGNYRPVPSQLGVGQGFYAMPRMVSPQNYSPENYRDQAAFYGMSRVGAYPESVVGPDSGFHPGTGRNVSDIAGTQTLLHPAAGRNVSDMGYHTMAAQPREMYYSVQAPLVPGYQNMTTAATAVEVRQGGPVSQESKGVVSKPSSQP